MNLIFPHVAETRAGIWAALHEGLHRYFAEEKRVQFTLEEARTIPGDIEGYFAVLGVNHLMKSEPRADASDTSPPCKPYGILDLGGSSTQIAIPSDCADIRRENSFVKSFPQSGMELTREAVGVGRD